MGNEEESKESLVAKVLVDNPIAKWMVDMSVEKEERGKRPFVETMRTILIAPNLANWNRFAEDKNGRINDNTLADYSGRFYLSSSISDHFAFASENAVTNCKEFEKNTTECMEYWGARRGAVICKDYYDDQIECVFKFKQLMRATAMMSKRRERYREYLAGLRDYDTVYIENKYPGAWRDPAPNPKDKMGFKIQTD